MRNRLHNVCEDSFKRVKSSERLRKREKTGVFRFHPARVVSLGTVSSPSAPNERALEQGCNLCSRNHWPVLISHKHVTAELGHRSVRVDHAEASNAAFAGSTSLSVLRPLLLLCLCDMSQPLARTAVTRGRTCIPCAQRSRRARVNVEKKGSGGERDLPREKRSLCAEKRRRV